MLWNLGLRLRDGLLSQVITNIDIQSIEPVDVHMRDSLSKSVQMAIEIATKLVVVSKYCFFTAVLMHKISESGTTLLLRPLFELWFQFVAV